MQKKILNGLKRIGKDIASAVDRQSSGKSDFYRMISESSQEMIYIIDRNLNIVFVNTFAAAQFKYAPAHIVGKHLSELFPQELFKVYAEEIKGVFKTGKPFSRENWSGFGDVRIWLDTQLIPIKDENGKNIYVMGVSRDSTEKKRIEQNLFETEHVYKTLVNTSMDAITICDLDGRIMAVSKLTLAMHDYSAEDQLLNTSIWELLCPEYREPAKEALKKSIVINSGEPERFEFRLIRSDSTVFDAELNCAFIRDSQGKPKAVINVIRDISDKKKAEKVLTESEKRFKELWENAPVAYHTVDRKGIITRVNRTEAKMLGYTVAEMLGKEVFDFILPEQRQEAKDRFRQKIDEQHISKSENRVYVRKDGQGIHVSIDDALECDHNGNIAGVRTTMVDMTERKQAEEDVKRSLEKLQLGMENTILAMAKIVEMKDPYTAGHQRRVAQLAGAIGRELGLPEEQVSGIHMAAVIHDIGKIYVPAEILSKPGKLTEIEFLMIKTHPKVSYDILKMVEFPWPIAKIVLQHHERNDGSGYPFGLTRDDIMIEAKIISIADVIEAITFHRPYRSAVGIDKALQEVCDKRGVLYDPEIVDACMRLFSKKGFEFDKS